MESFIIEGGHPLKGTITPQGAKNEALQVICTSILTDEPVRISNVPDILDVNNLIKLLQEIGVKVTKHSRHDYTFQSDELKLDYLDSLEFVKKCSSLRGSVLMIGPLLGRCGKATIGTMRASSSSGCSPSNTGTAISSSVGTAMSFTPRP